MIMETELVCYAWAVAKFLPSDDTITDKGVEVLRACLKAGKSVRQAAEELASDY